MTYKEGCATADSELGGLQEGDRKSEIDTVVMFRSRLWQKKKTDKQAGGCICRLIDKHRQADRE